MLPTTLLHLPFRWAVVCATVVAAFLLIFEFSYYSRLDQEDSGERLDHWNGHRKRRALYRSGLPSALLVPRDFFYHQKRKPNSPVKGAWCA